MIVRRPAPVLLVLAALLASILGAAPAPALAASLPVVDDFEAPLAAGLDPNGVPVGWLVANDGGTTVSYALDPAPPEQWPGAPTPNTVLATTMNVASFGVVIHNFENAAADAWVTQDWSPFLGFSLRVYGQNSGATLFIDLLDNRNPGSTGDDAERYTVSFTDDFSGWRELQLPFDSFTRKEIGNGAPADGLTLTTVHGWAFGALSTGGVARTWYVDDVRVYGVAPPRPLTVGFAANSFGATEGRTASVSVTLSKASEAPVTVSYATADGSALAGRDYLPAAGSLTFAPGVTEQRFSVTTFDNGKREGGKTVLLTLADPAGAEFGFVRTARIDIRDDETFDPALLDDFERAPDLFEASAHSSLSSHAIAADSQLALPGQGAYERVLLADSVGRRPFSLARAYAASQDWSGAEGLSFWLYGRGSGKDLTVTLRDNRAPDPGPGGWRLTWSDEFNRRAGSPPDSSVWGHEIGDGTANSNPGWGNSELEYYTDSTENAAHDGQGNLLITLREADPADELLCYYGPCQYTSARLLTQHKLEFGYGRAEARIKVPEGAGLWPAFWSLGNDIGEVGWPQTGEIDIMEFVGREPTTVFGTIHGPGYSGGASFGDTYDVGGPVGDGFHTFSIEWQPDLIVWYIDGIEYHRATPADVAPDEWVFDHPFFLLLNVAVGGNFGGPVGPDTTFPQAMAVDYVRIYGAADTAERFEATLKDDFRGWREVTLPFSAFERSGKQPRGAPNDGLTLSEVWGYELHVPGSYRGPLMLDQLRLELACPAEIVVTSAADSGPGSLRQALADVCRGGVVRFDPALAGQTITVGGELTVERDLTLEGAGAPGLALSGGDARRVLVVNAGAAASVRDLTIRDGYGADLGGAMIVNGQLTLERSVVEGSFSNGNLQFWQGGGGIYVGDGGSLRLRDSSVRGNATSGSDGGGIYGFFNSLIELERSTVSGNTAGNVGGGLRTLGEVLIENSTVSGNTSAGWHGGAIFHTDGVLRLVHSTVAANQAPAGTTGGIFVGTFGAAGASAVLAGSILAGNSGAQCIEVRFGSGPVSISSAGGNLGGDGSCSLSAPGDQPATDPQLGPLAANGGPTLTHALQPGSPAIDAAAAPCPATDQRGVARPQGGGCDSGAYEREP
jgi:beta-glucanase (GH16 family)